MKTSQVYNGKFIDVFIDTINRNGKEINWQRCSRKNNTNAVMIVAYHIEYNQYIMISEYRIPIRGRQIGFPAGLIEQNETVQETVIREMKQETGLDVVDFKSISPLVYNSSGLTDEGVYIAFVNVTGNISKDFMSANEDIKPLLVNEKEIAKMLQNKSLNWGAKSWLICNSILGVI